MKALVCDRFTAESLEELRLQKNFEVNRSEGLQPTHRELQDVEALLIRSRTKVDAKLFDKAPKLKVVITATSGFDHIDLSECQKRNVLVSYTPRANAQSAAETALLLTLGGLRNLSAIERAKGLNLWKDQLVAGNELRNKTVGLIGFGRVAKAFTQILQGFHCPILAYDPYVDADVMDQHQVKKTNLTGVLKESDVLSLHIPLTAETRGLMGKSNFSEMNSEALFVNTSRGGVVNEGDLLQALTQEQLAGAALDVFQHEPLPEDWPLRGLRNLYWTPHIGALTEEALHRASKEAIHKLIQYAENHQIDDALPNSLPWLACGMPQTTESIASKRGS